MPHCRAGCPTPVPATSRGGLLPSAQTPGAPAPSCWEPSAWWPCWSPSSRLFQDKTPPVASAKLPPVETVSPAQPTPRTPAPEGPVVVSVVGLVHKPGLVTLSSGARIADALSAAGGALDGADLIGLNMARRLTDGEQIIVGIAAPPGEPTTMGSSVASEPAPIRIGRRPRPHARESASGESVDLNTATEEQLDALPGVGPVTAAAIIAWREANGSFASVDQLGEVDGIGPARLEKLRAQVHV